MEGILSFFAVLITMSALFYSYRWMKIRVKYGFRTVGVEAKPIQPTCPICKANVEKNVLSGEASTRKKVSCKNCGRYSVWDTLGSPICVSYETFEEAKKRGVLSILIFLTLSPGRSHAFGEKEIVEGAINGKMSFQKGTLFNTSGKLTDQMIQRMKSKHPNFKDSMWYYNMVVRGNNAHIIWYDWYSKECMYAVIDQEKAAKDHSSILKPTENGGAIIATSRVIDIRACESLYNFYNRKN